MVTAHTRESLLWGLVGGLAFLVSIQGYDLLSAADVDALVKAAVAVAVATVAALATYAVRPRLPAGNEQP